MIIKKLAVPLINEKILPQAEHCYIATTAISEAGFDFLRTRLPPKCKIEIVTGLDGTTSPEVLRKTWRHYHDRITIKIYNRNLFHANVYMFDMPYRKAIAFTGSGELTLGGIKDNEEIFYKITDPKEIEALKSWFTGYYEFSEPLTESIIQEYEWIYPSMRQREIASCEEKDQVMELTTRGFNWDTIKFRSQYLKKEDYLTFSNSKASLNSSEIQVERTSVKTKLLHLHELIKDHFADLDLYPYPDSEHWVSSLDPGDHPDQKLRSMSIFYGRSRGVLTNPQSRELHDLLRLQIAIQQREVVIALLIGNPGENKPGRDYFKDQMAEETYRTLFYDLISGFGTGYWIWVNGEKKAAEGFRDKDTLWEFVKSDDWRYSRFSIGKSYLPGDPSLSNEHIASTMIREADKIILLYRHLVTKKI